jgi:Xaa-Pro aminopeptidase
MPRRGQKLPGEAPPPLGRDEYARRRRALMREMGRDAIAVIAAAPVHLRNNDVEYAYRQDSDFHYLTGFGEPESVAVLVPGRPQGEYLLFVRDRDPTRETWDGRRAGPAGACRDFGADDAFPIADIDEILPGLMESRARVYYTVGVNRDFDQRLVSWVNGLRAQAKHGRHAPHEIVALEHALHEMRLFKGIAAPGCPCTRSPPRSATSSTAPTPTSATCPSSAAAPTAASCTTARTPRCCATANCC